MCRSKEDGALGFRDMKAFNLAMLAKHGRRFLTNEDYLLDRLLKAGYYPTGSFLKTRMEYRPSFMRRSIFINREVLKKAICWNNGNGSSLSIWDDQWIPRPLSFKPIYGPSVDNVRLWVIDLID